MDRPSLEQVLAAAWSSDDWREIAVLVAVSGGPDSVALLRAMAAVKLDVGGAGRLIVAHFNHRLRQDASDDATFVESLARQLELPFEHGKANVAALANEHGDGIEAAARDARYAFLRGAAERNGARYLATGHTADDQVETVLFNILRGTGLAGLAGIPRARVLGPAVSLIRPLLNVRRSQVIEYLDVIGQPFRNDPSNTSRDFSRNRLRHELLPLLRETFNPEVDHSILRLSRLAADAQRLIERLAEELLDRCLCPGTIAAMVPATPEHVNHVHLNIAALQSADRHLVREMFIALWRQAGWPQQDMGFSEWDLLAEMAIPNSIGSAAISHRRVFSSNILVERTGEQLLLSRRGV